MFGSKKIIWTNHALDRLSDRKMGKELALRALQKPDAIVEGKNHNTKEYQMRYKQYLVTVIVAKADKGEHLVLSCWVDPPLPGSVDIKKKEEWRRYKKSGFWGKFWIIVKRQMGF